MYQVSELIEIGTKVNVDLLKIRDNLPEELLSSLRKDSSGLVVDYKMTDGMGIGFVLKLSNGARSWFFFDELVLPNSLITSSALKEGSYLQPLSSNNRRDSSNYRDIQARGHENDFDLPYKVIDLLNPIIFLRWLAFSLKDVY